MSTTPSFSIDEQLADILESLGTASWEGSVWRHMFADIPPSKSNVRGARWNPPGVEAIYASLDEPTVLAEAEYAMQVQPVPSRAPRRLYQLQVRLSNILDLTASATLARLGLSATAIGDIDVSRTQQVGGTSAWLGRDGILVPSARYSGTNLVIFPTNRDEEAIFDEVRVRDL